MSQELDRQRDRKDRIARLRRRLFAIERVDGALAAVIKGILDLLEDEL